VTFRQAIEQSPDLRGAYKRGLAALRRADKQHVDAEDTRLITGSMDVESCLRSKSPNDPQWDYAIGSRPRNRNDEVVYRVEVHPASPGEIKVVLAKLKWLTEWLGQNARHLDAMYREFIWVSSGKTSFTLSAPQRKQFALLGLQHKGRVFKIPATVDA
jgi:hypothetical protein